MVVDESTLTSVSLWDTQKHAEAVRQTRDDAQNELGDLLSAAPAAVISATRPRHRLTLPGIGRRLSRTTRRFGAWS